MRWHDGDKIVACFMVCISTGIMIQLQGKRVNLNVTDSDRGIGPFPNVEVTSVTFLSPLPRVPSGIESHIYHFNDPQNRARKSYTSDGNSSSKTGPQPRGHPPICSIQVQCYQSVFDLLELIEFCGFFMT